MSDGICYRTRVVLAALWMVTLACCFLPGADAQERFPNRALVIVSPLPAGGANDVTARLLAKEMSILLGQSVLVENRPGAGGAIGMSYIAHAKPDGYILGMASSSGMVSAFLGNTPPYTHGDFRIIGHISRTEMAVVARKDLPAAVRLSAGEPPRSPAEPRP